MPLLLDGQVPHKPRVARVFGQRRCLLRAGKQPKPAHINGVGLDGSAGESPAQQVVDEITAAGGEAIANGDDIADWSGAES